MDCKTCKENLEAYLKGRLPQDLKQSITLHLKECTDCSIYYSTFLLAEKVIQKESQLEPNPFLATRVMARIEALEQVAETVEKRRLFSRIWQPVLATVSIAAAVFIGVMAGNLYQPVQLSGQIPEELVYMDDAAMESLQFLMNE
ncbi:MAG: zf-HC2 domain-containing protein [Bacteroidales bacterium]|nr:zf-HC2 domain-containing protein [Bacteroidales bacterium]